MKIKYFLTFLIFFSSFKIFSQNILDPIVNSTANYSNNISYNTGEVFVVFTIQGNSIVNKNEEETFVEIISSEDILIYPNPVADVLNIKVPRDKAINNVILYSIDGRIIYDKRLINNQIDVSFLPLGVYILKTDYSETATFKIIKQ